MGSQSGHVPLRRWDPERIGPYAVLGRLGSGSMGQVFLGRSSAGRLVAVKTIRVELAEEAGFRTRFAQEVAAARKVSGVFTASVVEADPEADLPWLATAYVAAPSLSRLVLACGPLPADSVRWLAAGCAEALASIHGAGLVHRDLKPSNVLVASDGPRVIDFGVARAAERMGRTTARGAVGTPAYMAPEQARDTREASVASDVYSLGATLLFAATGHPPHSGASVMDVLARLATEEPDLSGLPDELTDLIAACLDRVPRNRPTSTAMLVQLGDFTVPQAGPDEDHPYLPDAAMALLTEYQRSPQFAAQAGPGEEDSTSASYTELPASYKPRPRRPPKVAGVRPPGAGGSGVQGSGPSGAGFKGWIRTHLAWAGWASAGAALIVAGVILGASLTSSSDQDNGPPAPPATVCGSSAQGGAANVCMNKNRGYPDTSFVVEGRGFSPRATLTVRVSELDPANNKLFSETSADQPVTGSDGTFQVPVAQLYQGSLQLGLVTVSVTGPGGPSFDTQFMVIPPGAPLNGAPPG
jgi:serine/threonine protein kinase